MLDWLAKADPWLLFTYRPRFVKVDIMLEAPLDLLGSGLEQWLSRYAVFLLGLLLLVVLVLASALVWIGGRSARRVRAHRRLGEAGELAAERILKRNGYSIIERQATECYQITVDGNPLTIYLRADFLVQKWGRVFVAEAKSGAASARPSGRTTRRQLLEYLYAFRVSGVLLVDVGASLVRSVEFPARRS